VRCNFFRWNLLGYITANLIQQIGGKLLGQNAADLTKLINMDKCVYKILSKKRQHDRNEIGAMHFF